MIIWFATPDRPRRPSGPRCESGTIAAPIPASAGDGSSNRSWSIARSLTFKLTVAKEKSAIKAIPALLQPRFEQARLLHKILAAKPAERGEIIKANLVKSEYGIKNISDIGSLLMNAITEAGFGKVEVAGLISPATPD